jgi:hypothetical protein
VSPIVVRIRNLHHRLPARAGRQTSQESERDQPMTDDNKKTEQPAPFKSYEEMTPEERAARKAKSSCAFVEEPK